MEASRRSAREVQGGAESRNTKGRLRRQHSYRDHVPSWLSQMRPFQSYCIIATIGEGCVRLVNCSDAVLVFQSGAQQASNPRKGGSALRDGEIQVRLVEHLPVHRADALNDVRC